MAWSWAGLGWPREREEMRSWVAALLGPAEVKESLFFFFFFLKIHYVMNLVKFITK
jgi:hypothetical protein